MSDDWKVTACTHDCPCACSLLARERGGTVEIRAYDAVDAGKGSFVCMKGLRFAKRLDDPRRILRPLLRSGSGFEEVSWDKALDIWAGKITDALSDFGPLSVMSLPGSGSLSFSKQLIPAFYSALGGCTTTKGNLCSAVGSAGLRESTLGFGVPFLSPDILLSAKGLLLWGRNVRHTHPRLVPILEERRSLGRETACIDIRLSETASRCDRFWRIVPGSDWALAAWLCGRLLRDGRDCGGWRGRAVNAEAFLHCAEVADPDFLLAQTGLSRDSAEEIYLWLLDNAPAAHMLAFGAQRYLHGDLQFRWIFALSVLSGAFDDAHAGLSFSKDETALFPKDLFEPPRNVRRFGIASWPRDILNADPPVRVMNIFCANPAKQNPDSSAVRAALDSVDFKVCIDIFMTETASLCDLVLPSTLFLEERDWVGGYGHSFLTRSERVVTPRGECRSDWEIFGALARRLGLPLDMTDLFERMYGGVANDPRLREVSRNLFYWDEPCYWTLDSSRALLPEILPDALLAPEGFLRLVTVHSDYYINGQVTDAPAASLEPVIHLPEDFCRSSGISKGSTVRVESQNGESFFMKAEPDPSLDSRTAWCMQGLRGINSLTELRDAPGFGAPFAECFVRVLALPFGEGGTRTLFRVTGEVKLGAL